MRKIVSILVLFIYISLSALEVISVHYCHGILKSIEFKAEKSICCENEHSNHASCCTDIVVKIDFDTDHLSSKQLDVDQPEIIRNTLFNNNLSIVINEREIDENSYPLECTPAPLSKIYRLNNSFLFYG